MILTFFLPSYSQVWLHLIDVVRNGVTLSKSANPSSLRIPALVSTFLVRISMVLSNPLDPMYKALSSFILAKPTIDLFAIPEFLRLFYSKDHLEHEAERNWILGKRGEEVLFCSLQIGSSKKKSLGVIRDGMKDDLDYSVAEKDFLIKLILTFYSSSSATKCSPSSRVYVRAILLKCAELSQPAFDLARNHDILTTIQYWIVSEVCAGLKKLIIKFG